jgi:hypothetical protein
VLTSWNPAAITTARRPGAALRLLSSSSKTKRLPGQDTDREGEGFSGYVERDRATYFRHHPIASRHAMATSKYVGFLISPQVRFEFSWSTSSSAAVRSYTIILHMIPSMLALRHAARGDGDQGPAFFRPAGSSGTTLEPYSRTTGADQRMSGHSNQTNAVVTRSGRSHTTDPYDDRLLQTARCQELPFGSRPPNGSIR